MAITLNTSFCRKLKVQEPAKTIHYHNAFCTTAKSSDIQMIRIYANMQILYQHHQYFSIYATIYDSQFFLSMFFIMNSNYEHFFQFLHLEISQDGQEQTIDSLNTCPSISDILLLFISLFIKKDIANNRQYTRQSK